MQAQEASDYGVADKIIGSRDNAFKKRVGYKKFFSLLPTLSYHMIIILFVVHRIMIAYWHNRRL